MCIRDSCKGLQQRFVKTLKLPPDKALFPDFGLYAVAIGAAIFAGKEDKTYTFEDLVTKLENATEDTGNSQYLTPLFSGEDDYSAFVERHAKATVETVDVETYQGDAYLGIDCGSTTTKLVLMTGEAKLLYTYYSSNKGNPVRCV